MKGNPAVPGGSLTSKPTWSNTPECLTTSAFFRLRWRGTVASTRDGPDGQVQLDHGPTGVSGRKRKRRTGTTETMTTKAQNVKFRRQMEKLGACRRTPSQVKMPPRERIRIKRRCNLCGRARAVYRKFGICRICFREMASNGLIPGVQKASW